ncbi:MAG: glycosyltransferase [Thermoplasmatales archaeon]
MRVALCSDTYHPIADGVSKHLVDFKAELEKRGHAVRVYTVFSTNDGVFGLPSYRFPLYKEYRIGIPVYELYRDMGRFKPDVVHIHTPFVLGTMGYRFARKRGIPTVGTYHTDFVNMDGTINFPFVKSLLNIGFQYNMHLYAKVDMVVTPSRIIDKYISQFVGRTETIPVGIDLKKFTFSPEKDDFYLFLGRLTNDKGVLELLKASSILSDRKFKIAGTGPLRPIVEEWARKNRNLEYLGYVSEDEKVNLLSRAKLLIVPSRAETFGVVYVEAMASGTPVVGSHDSREIGILQDGYNGWSVAFGDEQDLVRKISQIERLDLAPIMKNAFNSSREYSIEKTTDALEKLYGELIESKGKR